MMVGVDAAVVGDATGAGVVGTKCSCMNRSGSGPGATAEQYPRLLSAARVRRQRRLCRQPQPRQEERTPHEPEQR